MMSSFTLSSEGKTVEVASTIGLFCLVGMGLHFVYKVAFFTHRSRQVKKQLAKIPGKEIDLSMKDVIANIHRLQEHLCDVTVRAFPGAELVHSQDPYGEVMCISPRAVETMLKSRFDAVTKVGPEETFVAEIFEEFVGQGIFTFRHGEFFEKEHHAWKNERKTAAKLFTKSNFNNLVYQTILEKSDDVLQVIDDLVQKNASQSSDDAMDIQSTFFSFTFCMIQKIFFNRDTSASIYGQFDEIQHAFDEAHRLTVKQYLMDRPANIVTIRLLPFPLGSLSPHRQNSLNPGFWFYRNYVSGIYPEFKKHLKTLARATDELAREARESIDKGLEERTDLMSYFLQSGYTNEQLRSLILNFIIAGRDTTACTLSWLLFELTQHQEVQDKLAEEIRAVIGKENVPQMEDIDIKKMPYLHKCVLETLRMHPPVPLDTKIATKDITFPDGTFVAAGLLVCLPPFIMGRDPSRYSEPNVFKPDRWKDFEDPVSSPLAPTMYEFPVFQAGPRACLGMKLAKIEIKLLMSRLLQKYSFALDPKQDVNQITHALMITVSLSNTLDFTSHELNVIPTVRP